MNRKERFYTGTVLPAVVAGDGFVHLPRLLRLCGLPDVTVDSHGSLNGGAAVQLLTEYGFTESVITAEDRARYADRPRERDTPDVVAVGEDWLVAIEAKMFHRPSRAALAGQMARQRVIVDYLARSLSVPRERVRHVLLLPEQLADDRPDVWRPVVTWQQVLGEYGAVGPAYWLAVLPTIRMTVRPRASASRTSS